MGLFILALEQRMSKEKKEPIKPGGFISIWRCVQEHWIYDDAEYFKAWCTILMNVQYKDDSIEVLIKGELLICNRGESVKSLDTWATLFGKRWNKGKVKRFFSLLKKSKIIDTQNERVTTRLSVCNYDSYQLSPNAERTQNDTQTIRRPNADDTQNEPDNKVNKDNNVNKKERMLAFSQKCRKLNTALIETELVKFISWWTESNPGEGKLRFETGPIFDFEKRFVTWEANIKNPITGKNYTTYNQGGHDGAFVSPDKQPDTEPATEEEIAKAIEEF